MTIIAGITGINMRAVFARCACTLMAIYACSTGSVMVKVDNHPTIWNVAVIASVSSRYVTNRFTDRQCIVMTGLTTACERGMVYPWHLFPAPSSMTIGALISTGNVI
jgi:hypothetical protein